MLAETVSPTITTTTPTILPPADASLQELRKLQREWLEAAREAGHPLTCKIIAKTLGEKARDKIRKEIEIYRWESGNLRIEFWEWSSYWQPHRQDWARLSWLQVHYADLRVCAYFESTSNQAQENHFIPGSWTNELADPLRQAEQIISNRNAAEMEEQRQELLTRLLGLE